MKRAFYGMVLLFVICSSAFALIIVRFSNTDSFLKQMKDIVIADCLSIPTNKPVLKDGHWVTVEVGNGMRKIEVDVLQTLKGDKRSGKQIIASHYPMVPGKKYLLSSTGGSVGETGGVAATDFLAVQELSVVEIPPDFDLKSLDGKELKEQVQSIFSRHLFELERKLAPLIEEKVLLDKAVSDRKHEWFESEGPVAIGPVVDVATTNSEFVWLELDGKKLQWSGSLPGKTGYLYFERVGESRKPYWEFSQCEVAKLEDLAGKPLKARFYGMYTPAVPGEFGRGGLQSTYVSVGQVWLARTVDEPQKVFAIQIIEQSADQERMSARYSIIHR